MKPFQCDIEFDFTLGCLNFVPKKVWISFFHLVKEKSKIEYPSEIPLNFIKGRQSNTYSY